jgi:hypothetical protein
MTFYYTLIHQAGWILRLTTIGLSIPLHFMWVAHRLVTAYTFYPSLIQTPESVYHLSTTLCATATPMPPEYVMFSKIQSGPLWSILITSTLKMNIMLYSRFRLPAKMSHDHGRSYLATLRIGR